MSGARWLEHDWWPSPLPDNVSVGEGSWVYSSYAFLHYASSRPRGVTVGARSGVYQGTFFDLGRDGEVHIGDYCTIAGPIFAGDVRVEIGNYSMVSYQVLFAESQWAIPAAGGGEQRDIYVGEDAWIGARAVLLSGARLGRGAIVGACAMVDFEVPPFAIVAGDPARIVSWARPRGDV